MSPHSVEHLRSEGIYLGQGLLALATAIAAARGCAVAAVHHDMLWTMQHRRGQQAQTALPKVLLQRHMQPEICHICYTLLVPGPMCSFLGLGGACYNAGFHLGSLDEVLPQRMRDCTSLQMHPSLQRPQAHLRSQESGGGLQLQSLLHWNCSSAVLPSAFALHL